jgi:hypothetical protein
MDLAKGAIDLLEAYTKLPVAKGDHRTDEHAALRAYFEGRNPRLDDIQQKRLGTSKKRKIDPGTKYIGEHALELETPSTTVDNVVFGRRIYRHLYLMGVNQRKLIGGAPEAYAQLSELCEMKDNDVVVKDGKKEELRKKVDNAKQAVRRVAHQRLNL